MKYPLEGKVPNYANHKSKILPIIILFYALFIFSIPFESLGGEEGGGGAFTITKLIGYAFFVSCILFQPKLCFGKAPKAFLYFIIYLIMYGLMGLFQPESYYSAIMLQGLTIAQMLVLMLISFNLMKNKRVLNIALISLLVSCGFVAIMQLLGITATESLSDRISVLGEDPNIAASVLAIGAVVLIGFIMKESLSTKIKLLLFGLLLPTVLAIIHTGSRGALIALAVGLLVFTLSKGNMKIKLRNTIVVYFASLL